MAAVLALDTVSLGLPLPGHLSVHPLTLLALPLKVNDEWPVVVVEGGAFFLADRFIRRLVRRLFRHLQAGDGL